MSRGPGLSPTLVLLLGYPGTGKYTVAGHLVAQLEAAGQAVRLLDNHRMANLLFDLIAEADGATPLPPAIFARVREVNLTVVRTIDELSPPSWSFVFTHHLVDYESDRDYLAVLARTAANRGAAFVPVLLTCERGELLARVPGVERREQNKLTDPGLLASMLDTPVLVPPAALRIDVTDQPPSQTAAEIVSHIASLD